MQEHPPLESVVREALHHALEEVRQGLDSDQKEAYADWFENWARRLNGSGAIQLDSLSDVVGKLATGALPADQNGTELALDQLFRCAMERLDGEARAQQTADARGSLSITAEGSFRAMPDTLLQLLTERLPAPQEARFRDLVALPEHHRAWIAVEQSFQDYARSAFAQLIAATKRIDERTERILEILEQQLKRAEDEKRIVQEEARAERAEKREWVNKYVKLMEDVAARKEEPGEPSLAALLEAGDLDGAIRLKTSQIEQRKGEIKKLAHDWSELGRGHDLRFCVARCYGMLPPGMATRPRRAGLWLPVCVFRPETESIWRSHRCLPETSSNLHRSRADRHDAEQPGDSVQCHAADEGGRDRLPSGALDLPEAETAWLEALSIYRRTAEANPEAFMPYVATTLNNLANLYSATHRLRLLHEHFLLRPLH